MKILLTGGLGHIGSYLINNLKNFEKIYIVDNLNNERYDVLFNIKNKKIKFIYGDLTNKIFCKNLPKTNFVIHLASITNAEKSIQNKKYIYYNNLESFKNIVKLCNKFNSRLIHFSSTSIYGPQKGIVDENQKKLLPQSPYAEIKLLEEKILRKQIKIKYISLRLGTISGFSNGMKFHTAVNKFCFNAVMNLSIPIWNDALNLYRPYLSLKDLVKTIEYILKKKYFPCDIFNVISENKTVKQILDLIENNNIKIKKKFITSKISQKTSFFTSKEKIEKLGLKLNAKISNDISYTIKKLKK